MTRLRLERLRQPLLTRSRLSPPVNPLAPPPCFPVPPDSSPFSTASPATSCPHKPSCPPPTALPRPFQARQRRFFRPEPVKPPELGTSDPSVLARLSRQELMPSPNPQRASSSAKLAALHARLSLPPKLPLGTLARALVDPSADPNPHFNNANLAFLGSSIVNYHGAEMLMCKYPRLPMLVLYEAMRAYAGPESLARIARQWGVEPAAFPGGEVDPGLLQFSEDPDKAMETMKLGYKRKNADNLHWRIGVSSRVVLDDPFGDRIAEPKAEHEKRARAPESTALTPADEEAAERAAVERVRNQAFAGFVRAVVGAVYIHAGREMAASFARAHVYSRQVNMVSLFSFNLPTRELSQLCAREEFDPPVARLLSETGRMSRTPVYVVGIYSGADKLGEGSGPSPDFARLKASMNALRAWYLYSPGDGPRVPSEMLNSGAPKWKPVYVDMGEII